MKPRTLLLFTLLVLLALILLGGCVKPNKELIYGTWVNEKMVPQKTAKTSGSYKDYLLTSDGAPFDQGREQIVDYWMDSEGSVWYKTQFEATGFKWQGLEKISMSGTVLEYVMNGVAEFDPKSFPTKVDPSGGHYHIYYRAKK